MILPKRIPLLLLFLILGVSQGNACAAEVDTNGILRCADSLMKVHNVCIPKKYVVSSSINRVNINQGGNPYWPYVNHFSDKSTRIDTVLNDLYAIQIKACFNDALGGHFNCILVKSKSNTETKIYYRRSDFLLLSSLKNKTSTFETINHEKIKQLLEKQHEVRVTGYDTARCGHLYYYTTDTLFGKTQFLGDMRVIPIKSLNETQIFEPLDFDDHYIIGDSLAHIKYRPVVLLEGGDRMTHIPKCCGLKTLLYRKHVICIDLNTFEIIYDGYPSFQTEVWVD